MALGYQVIFLVRVLWPLDVEQLPSASEEGLRSQSLQIPGGHAGQLEIDEATELSSILLVSCERRDRLCYVFVTHEARGGRNVR